MLKKEECENKIKMAFFLFFWFHKVNCKKFNAVYLIVMNRFLWSIARLLI